MKEKRAGVMHKVHPDLLVPPHIVSNLIDLLLGEWQPDSSQQQRLVAHLMECSYCRTAIIVLLSAEQEYKDVDSSSKALAHNLLRRFVAIHHEIEAQDYEQMGAYAESIVAEGKEQADRHFPVLAEHVKRCSSCEATLKDILAFLNEPEETH